MTIRSVPTRSSCRTGRSPDNLARHAFAVPIFAATMLVVIAITASAQVVRDSAGIRIVENTSRAGAPIAFRLGNQLLDLGGPADNPADEFNRGLGLGGVRLSDGTVVVPDKVRVQLFDVSGRRLATFGREGAGPQEFRAINPAETCRTRGDTVVTGDHRNGRFAVISGRRIVKTVPHEHFGGTISGCFDDGTVLLQAGLPYATPTYIVHLTRLTLEGKVVNAFGPMTFRSPSPVSHSVYAMIEPSGQRVYVGDGATSEVRVFDANGRLVQIVRSADPPIRITAADIEAASRLAPNAHMPPDQGTHPTYDGLRVDPSGRIWMHDFVLTRQTVDRWTCFDADGRLLGRLEIPRKGAQYVVAFGANDVQVMRYDDDGFQRLTFFALDRVNR